MILNLSTTPKNVATVPCEMQKISLSTVAPISELEIAYIFSRVKNYPLHLPVNLQKYLIYAAEATKMRDICVKDGV